MCWHCFAFLQISVPSEFLEDSRTLVSASAFHPSQDTQPLEKSTVLSRENRSEGQGVCMEVVAPWTSRVGLRTLGFTLRTDVQEYFPNIPTGSVHENRPTPKPPITEFQNCVNKGKTLKAPRTEKQVKWNLDHKSEFMRQQVVSRILRGNDFQPGILSPLA